MILFEVLSILYFILLVLIYAALRNLNGAGAGKYTDKISVVIAARNESSRIHSCLESLARLEYPRKRLEIIIVDDGSTDNTAEIIDSYCQKNENWHLLRIRSKSSELRGKNNALQAGIEKAASELIFTTDADCIVNPAWIKTMSDWFHSDVVMVIGFSPAIHGEGFFHRFIEFDTLFSAIVAAASAQLGYPYTSTGRNLGYRKKSFTESGGFLFLKKYRSGDDIHLTRRFRDKKLGKIRYCVHPDTYVRTFIPQSFTQFFQQQIRKNSKIMRSGLAAGFIISLIFLYQILFYTIPLLDMDATYIWLVFIIMRFLIESVTLIYAMRIFRQTQLISFLPVALLIYPLFILFFGVLGTFQKYSWKN